MILIVLLVIFDVVMAAAVVAALVHMAFAYRNAVPPVMTPREVMPELLKALDLPKVGKLYELGCGDGRVLAAVARQRPELTLVGIDNNPVVLAAAWLRLRDRAQLVRGEIMRLDFRDANRVFAYLGPGLMAQLESKLEQEMPTGSRLVSQQFPLPTRRPTWQVGLAHGKPHASTLYVYDY